MAKTVTYTDFTTPSGFTVTAISGGTLTASTTYYYKVIAVYSTVTTPYYMNGKSLASPEVSGLTTITNKSLTLSWSHPKGEGGGYRIFRSNTSGSTYTSCMNIGLTDVSYNTGGTCTWTDDGSVTNNIGNCAYQNTSHGKLTLLGSTAGDPFSIVDLYNADVVGGWGVVRRLDESTYRVEPFIQTHANLYWVDEEKTIIIADGFDTIYTGTGNYRFGRMTGSVTNRGCHLIFKNYAYISFTPNILNAYKTTFDVVYDYNPLVTTYYSITFFSLSFNSGNTIDCQSNKMRGFAPGSITNCYMKNFVATEYDIGFGIGAGTFENVIGMAGSRPFQTGGSTVIRVKNFTSIDNGTATVYVLGLNNTVTMVNTNVAPTGYNAVGNATGSVVYEKFTYNLKVYQNDSATSISGATVNIYDVFNNLLYSGLTNVTGDIPEQELLYYKHTFVLAVRTSTKYAPHRLVVSKTGMPTM